MPKPIINGSLQPVRKSVKVSYDPNRGRTITQEWESAGDNLTGLANTCGQARMAYEYYPGTLRSRLIATATDAQAGIEGMVVDSWQLLANENQKSVLQSPAVLAMDQDNVSAILHAADKYKNGKVITLDPAEYSAAELALYQALTHGQDVYALSQYVLRHTTNVWADSTRNIADFGVECIYTTAQLLSEARSSNLWVYPMPYRLAYKIGEISSMTSVGTLVWGWRKLASTETTAPNNRIDISTEYWLALWDTLFYDLY
jgi:hypothetical protein